MKKNITQFAEKSDIRELRSGLKGIDRSLRSEILRVEEKVESLEEGQEQIKEQMKENQEKVTQALIKLQETLDAFVGTVDDLRTDNEVGAHQLHELEKGVTKLESTSRTA